VLLEVYWAFIVAQKSLPRIAKLLKVGNHTVQTNLSRKRIAIIAATLLPYSKILLQQANKVIRLGQNNSAFSTKVKRQLYRLSFGKIT
jgi:hypothetical protein